MYLQWLEFGTDLGPPRSEPNEVPTPVPPRVREVGAQRLDVHFKHTAEVGKGRFTECDHPRPADIGFRSVESAGAQSRDHPRPTDVNRYRRKLLSDSEKFEEEETPSVPSDSC